MQLPFYNKISLQQQHVSLETLSEHDFSQLKKIGVNPKLWRYMSSQYTTSEALEKYLYSFLKNHKERSMIPVCIKDNSSQKAIGMTCIGNINNEKNEVELGWTWIEEAYQKTSTNRIVKLLMLNYIFNELNCNKVVFRVNEKNNISMRSLEKIGASFNGITEIYVAETKQTVGVANYCIQKKEWKSSLEAKLQKLITAYNS
ncbi:GNAT family N-acetyltransferase [Kordia sp.]|uniref:GNAT family N-acetyltransferase n=1 Tax=Kordia sp. TaxID=1965332 RepID=UPI003D2DE3D8